MIGAAKIKKGQKKKNDYNTKRPKYERTKTRPKRSTVRKSQKRKAKARVIYRFFLIKILIKKLFAVIKVVKNSEGS